MSDIDIHAPTHDRKSKIQLENQQSTKHADFRDAQWGNVVYPNRSHIFKPARSASLFEIVCGLLGGLTGLIFIIRLFFVSDENRTIADRVAFVIFFLAIAVVLVAASIILIARALKYVQERKVFILPNGLPVNIDTILNDYAGLNTDILTQPGYFSVEHARASNPIVAPGEITHTYSPSNTYAPSNMPREKDDQQGDALLARMLDMSAPESKESTQTLPTFINFFEYVDAREPGYIIAGMLESGELLQVPIMRIFNHLVGGQIGSGKSIYLRSLVYQLIDEADE